MSTNKKRKQCGSNGFDLDPDWLMHDTVLIPFIDDRQNPWGERFMTCAKVQFCEITCKYWRDKDPKLRCPWVNTPQNVYLLVGSLSAQNLAQAGEKKWSDILPPDKLALMKKDKELVLGYVVGEKVEDTIRIHWIQSFVRRVGVMKQILFLIEKNAIPGTDKYIPWEIDNAPEYVKEIWAKFGFES